MPSWRLGFLSVGVALSAGCSVTLTQQVVLESSAYELGVEPLTIDTSQMPPGSITFESRDTANGLTHVKHIERYQLHQPATIIIVPSPGAKAPNPETQPKP